MTQDTHINKLSRFRTRDISVSNRIADDGDVVAEFGADARCGGDADVGLCGGEL